MFGFLPGELRSLVDEYWLSPTPEKELGLRDTPKSLDDA